MRKDDRMKAMLFESPEAIPISAGALPAVWKKYREVFEELVLRHPLVFGAYKKGSRDFDAMDHFYSTGAYADEWGCVWNTVEEGVHSTVTGHPVPTRASVHTLKSPVKDAGFPHGFMYLRLGDLRGFEEIMVDFAEEPPELRQLIDIVLAYNLRQVDLLLKQLKEPQLLYFGDDLGMQASLPISPEKWRKYLKPCFAQIYDRCRKAGHWIYMHTDGHILEIIPDLIECGVNVVNPQVRANGLDQLAKVCKGKVCLDLDLDRQMFPFCTPAEIDAHVREAVEKLGSPKGGLWLKAEISHDIPLENMEAICTALERYRNYFNLASAAR